MRRVRVLAGALVCASAAAACTARSGAPDADAPPVAASGTVADTTHRAAAAAAGVAPAPIDSALALATFDSVWSRIERTHYDTAFNGVDWHAVRAELRPRARAAGTMPRLRAIIGDMLGRLGESHYALIPAEAVAALETHDTAAAPGAGDVGVDVRLVGDELLISRLADDGAGARAGLRAGMAVRAIAGRQLGPRIAVLQSLPEADRRRALTTFLYQVNAELKGAPGTPVTLSVAPPGSPAAEARDRTIVRAPAEGVIVQFGNLPPQVGLVEYERIEDARGCTGVIRLNIWLAPLARAFDSAVDALRDCRGIVVDLRGNPGGVAGMVMGAAGHFLNDTIPLGFMRTRTGNLRLKANPRRVRTDGAAVEPFSGPLAVLIDEMSASTSEFFAGGLQAIGRARVFGATSAGQALPALLVQLPSGDVLMHVIADFTGPGGIRIEGRGVVPDVPVPLTPADLVAGRDAPLDAALAWIAGEAAGAAFNNGRLHE